MCNNKYQNFMQFCIAIISYTLIPLSAILPIYTGKHVVLQLLQKKQNVKAIVRSKEKLINSIDDISADGKSSRDLNIVSRLDTTEASLLDLSQDELEKVRSYISVFLCLAILCYNAHMLTIHVHMM